MCRRYKSVTTRMSTQRNYSRQSSMSKRGCLDKISRHRRLPNWTRAGKLLEKKVCRHLQADSKRPLTVHDNSTIMEDDTKRPSSLGSKLVCFANKHRYTSVFISPTGLTSVTSLSLLSVLFTCFSCHYFQLFLHILFHCACTHTDRKIKKQGVFRGSRIALPLLPDAYHPKISTHMPTHTVAYV